MDIANVLTSLFMFDEIVKDTDSTVDTD